MRCSDAGMPHVSSRMDADLPRDLRVIAFGETRQRMSRDLDVQ